MLAIADAAAALGECAKAFSCCYFTFVAFAFFP